MSKKEVMPHVKRIRVSIGTAGVLGLLKLHSDAEPSTAYVMTYTPDSCRANCAFCPQARGSSSSKELLSRVVWPDFSFNSFLEKIVPVAKAGTFERICIQTLNYADFIRDTSEIVSAITSRVSLPISVSCPPIGKSRMERLREIGVERIGIPLDAATPQIFEKIKGHMVAGPYRWESHLKGLKDALEVFGKNKVTTHIIVGLGETERDAVELIQYLRDMGVNSSLFAFTPIKGTKLEGLKRPATGQYRRVQLARYLIMQGYSSAQVMKFDSEGRVVDFGISQDAVNSFATLGSPFMTAGCSGCNRPFYTESPKGPIYNYPRALSDSEKQEILDELRV
jgi:biotin synthase-related radical SAM superfamily protein